ncbi:hypothetical protein, partial [Bacteroides thetaiotaomicron]|uniref:hypothetical protein n=1 Tax=Bacteroides thetaiotaomicron TaxID=818 RepID=UPI002547B1E1
MKLVIDVSKKGVLDKLNAFLESFQQTWTSINVMVRDYRPEEGIIEMLCINYDITTLKETEQKLIIAR